LNEVLEVMIVWGGGVGLGGWEGAVGGRGGVEGDRRGGAHSDRVGGWGDAGLGGGETQSNSIKACPSSKWGGGGNRLGAGGSSRRDLLI